MRALLLVLDGLGLGATPDADQYNSVGANTLGHLYEGRPSLRIPVLESLGLKAALCNTPEDCLTGLYGRMRPCSRGNESVVGHWELAGVVTDQPLNTFLSFPTELVHPIETEAGVTFLGNQTMSTAEALRTYAEEHLRTGRPILYTTASSAMQIAAHESVISRPALYRIATIARRHCERFRIGRVIARPFAGRDGTWTEGHGRADFPLAPPHTVLNSIAEMGIPVEGIGKIGDIFARSGVTRSHPVGGNAEAQAVIERLWNDPADAFLFANLPDFDSLGGHRRDLEGYADLLEQFDRWLGEFLVCVEPDDLVIITSDHGNDPALPGTDHTREDVPLLVVHQERVGNLGLRHTFADVAATLGHYFRVPLMEPLQGTSFL